MAAEEKKAVRITQQFRETHNMTYELQCSGSLLIVRMFPVGDPPTEWKVEAKTSNAEDAVVASATGASRSAAFELVAQWWRENSATHALGTIDWPAVAQALTAVRAL